MVCIYCGKTTRVSNSRKSNSINQVWRRRTCAACGAIFTTRETVEPENALVLQSMSVLEPFRRDTLLISVYDSLKHRKTALTDASALTDTIISACLPKFDKGCLQKSQLTDITHQILDRFDKSAGVHYRAFHL